MRAKYVFKFTLENGDVFSKRTFSTCNPKKLAKFLQNERIWNKPVSVVYEIKN